MRLKLITMRFTPKYVSGVIMAANSAPPTRKPTMRSKPVFINALRGCLKQGGRILIGDVAFETRDELEKCKKSAGDEWDNDEIYFVVEELRKYFPEISFMPVSYCAGILTLQR